MAETVAGFILIKRPHPTRKAARLLGRIKQTLEVWKCHKPLFIAVHPARWGGFS
jgi:hypothetical protein